MATSYLLTNPWSIFGYLVLLYVSYKVVVYAQRLFFHPLSQFPGPKLSAASRLYEFYWDSIQRGRLWMRLPELHDRYGPIIRMGPDELHIQDPEFFFYLFSFKPLDKYALAGRQFGLQVAMFGTEDHKMHAQRRAAYGDSFSKGQTLKLQPMVIEKVMKGCAKIEERMEKHEVIDLAFLFRAITAEISTVWMYGQEYGYFEDEKTTKGLYDRRFDSLFGLTNLGRFIPFWIPMLLIMLRGQIREMLGSREPNAALMNFMKFADKMLKQLIAEHGIQQEPSSAKEYKTAASIYLHSSLPEPDKTGYSLTVATMAPWSGGWDTTAFALTQGAYEILRSQDVSHRLRRELQQAWPVKNEKPTTAVLDKLPYLNAVTHETLRLMHGALCRITRINTTASEHYKKWTIPAGTKISMSLPDIHFDESIWGDDATTFRPTRWLPGEKGHFDGMEKYLVTFGRGTRGCAGQELAWMELRLIFATLFRRFEFVIDEAAGMTDDDILPWSDGFTPGCKNMIQWLPVYVREVEV